LPELTADLERAREALARGSWAEAYEGLREFDSSTLTAGDLEGLADAAWWISRMDESIAARQKAYAAYAAAAEDRPAAALAIRLCVEHFLRREPAVAGGWLMRAHRHLGELPECVEHGFLAVVESTVARFSGELERSIELARRATQIGHRFGHLDLLAMAIHIEGLALIASGRVREGVAQLDEAMTSVVAGELSPFFTGAVYCNVIEACLQLADVGRATEWSEAARAWCETLPPESPYPGICRINRAQVSTLRGRWLEAEAEASRASEELMRLDPMTSGAAWYVVGEIRRRMGRLAEAEEAFGRAHELGFEPQPGLALLRLAQGKIEAAASAIRVAVSAGIEDPFRRVKLLSAQVDVAIAADDLDAARAACEELEAIARGSSVSVFDGATTMARGALCLAEGDSTSALESLRKACATCQELKLPYETAQARMLYGLAVRAAGAEDDARIELRAALTGFERLGAEPDAAKASALLAGPEALPRGLTAREAEVLRLVAAGKSNRVIAAELVISEHTVARHLQNIFAKLEVASRSAATAFAFEHGMA